MKKIIVLGQLSNVNLVEIVYVVNIHSIYAWNALSKYFIHVVKVENMRQFMNRMIGMQKNLFSFHKKDL